MIETISDLLKPLHSFGSGCKVWLLHRGEFIQIQSVSGASDGSVTLMSSEATSPVENKRRAKKVSDDVADAIEHCDRILTMCDEVDSDSRGADFAADIAEKVQGVRDWIEEHDHVTEKQLAALDGWEQGVSKWLD